MEETLECRSCRRSFRTLRPFAWAFGRRAFRGIVRGVATTVRYLGNISESEQAWEMTRHYLDSWPAGLREFALTIEKPPSFSLADSVTDVDYHRFGDKIRQQYPHITCHRFTKTDGKRQEQQTELLKGLGEIQFCRSLELEPSVDDTILEALRRFEELVLEGCPNIVHYLSFSALEKLHSLRLCDLTWDSSLRLRCRGEASDLSV